MMVEVEDIAAFGNSSDAALTSGPIYEFEYDYYEFDISFDGLKANKCEYFRKLAWIFN